MVAVLYRSIVVGLAFVLAAGTAHARIEAEALVGRPFGVARITISGADAAIDLNRVLIDGGGGRVFYPAVGTGMVGRLIGQILGDPADRPSSAATVYFLFRGEEPIDLTVYTPQAVKITLEPARGNQRQMDRLFTGWWREYSAAARQVRSNGDRPPILEDYLLTMLSRRLGLEPVLLDRLQGPGAKPALTTQSLELLLNMERLRTEVMKETMQGRGDFGQRADLPLPPAANWADLPLPANLPQTEVEPLALHVPPECFYIRFGRFSNYLWMNKLIEEHGGDIAGMVTLRSYVAPDGQAGPAAARSGTGAPWPSCWATRSLPTWRSSAATPSRTKEQRSACSFKPKTMCSPDDLAGQRQTSPGSRKRRRHRRGDGDDRRARSLFSFDARQPRAVVLRNRWQVPSRHDVAGDRRAVLRRRRRSAIPRPIG